MKIRRIDDLISTADNTLDNLADGAANWFNGRVSTFNSDSADIIQGIKGVFSGIGDTAVNLYDSTINAIETNSKNKVRSALNSNIDTANSAYISQIETSVSDIASDTKSKFKDLYEARRNIEEDFQALIDFRTVLYENFITALTENYYATEIDKKISLLKQYSEIGETTNDNEKEFSSSDNNSIHSNLEALATIFESSKDGTISDSENTAIKKIGLTFNTLFNKYGEMYYGKALKFIDMRFTEDYFYGLNVDTAKYFINNVDDYKNFPFSFEIYRSSINVGTDSAQMLYMPFLFDYNINFSINDELILEDGTKTTNDDGEEVDYSYIIKTENDFNKFVLNGSGYSSLANDLSIDSPKSSKTKFSINNLDGYGHSLTINIKKPVYIFIENVHNLRIYLNIDPSINYSDDIYIGIDSETRKINGLKTSALYLDSSKNYYRIDGTTVLGYRKTHVFVFSDADGIYANDTYFTADKDLSKVIGLQPGDIDYSSRRLTGEISMIDGDSIQIGNGNNSLSLKIANTNADIRKDRVNMELEFKSADNKHVNLYNFNLSLSLENAINTADTDLDGIIYKLGELSLLKGGIGKDSALVNHKDDGFDYYRTLVQDLLNAWGYIAANAKEKADSLKKEINGYTQSLSYIIQYREHNSSTFDDTYTFELLNSIALLNDYISRYDVYKDVIIDKSNKMLSAAVDAVVNIGKSILVINKYIAIYSPFFIKDSTIEEYDLGVSDLKNLLSVYDESVLQKLESTDWEYKPLKIRLFSEWDAKISAIYIPDDIHSRFMLYATQELGLNLNKIDLTSVSDFACILKQIFNRAFLSVLHKHIYTELVAEPNSTLETKINVDEELSYKNINISEDAIYEVIPYELKMLVPDLKVFEKVDFYDILAGSIDIEYISNINSDLSNGTKDIVKEIKKIVNLVSFIFLKEIFKTKNKNEILKRIKDIYSYLFSSTIDVNFKVLILRVMYVSLLERIWNDAKDNTNRIISLDDFMNIGLAYMDETEYIKEFNANEAKNDLSKFITVWGFYYSSTSSILSYTTSEFQQYMLNAEENLSARKYITTEETFLDKVENTFERISRLFVDSVSNTWDDIKNFF